MNQWISRSINNRPTRASRAGLHQHVWQYER